MQEQMRAVETLKDVTELFCVIERLKLLDDQVLIEV